MTRAKKKARRQKAWPPVPTCRHPDRDEPRMMCGYPLPCPWHTAVIDPTATPPTVMIPITSEAAWNTRNRLAEIVGALAKLRKVRP